MFNTIRGVSGKLTNSRDRGVLSIEHICKADVEKLPAIAGGFSTREVWQKWPEILRGKINLVVNDVISMDEIYIKNALAIAKRFLDDMEINLKKKKLGLLIINLLRLLAMDRLRRYF